MKIRFTLLFALLAVSGICAQAQRTPPLKLIQTIALPNVEGRIDHLAVNLERQRLFVAALGNNTLEILDIREGKRLHAIPGLHEPQGVACAPAYDRIYVANAQGGACEIYDSAFHHVGSVKFSGDADNARYDDGHQRLYVGYGDGALGMIDVTSDKHVGDIQLAGHPESFQLETAGTKIYVNVPSAGHIAVIDRAKQAVIATWPVTLAKSNFPMALDEAHHRLIVGCRNPAKLLVYNTQTGKVVASADIAGDTDDVFYDGLHKRLYASCGAGFLDVLQQKDADHYFPLAHIPTAAGARTSLFVPQSGRLYLAVPHRGNQKAEVRVYSTQP